MEVLVENPKLYWNERPCLHGHHLRYKTTDQCSECRKLIDQQPHRVIARRNYKDPLGAKRRSQKYNSSKKGKLKLLLNRARERSRKLGLPFNLQTGDVVIPDVCPVLGIPLVHGKGSPVEGSPTLDRLIPEFGYVVGNVSVISHKANTMKSSGTAADLRKIADWMDARLLELKA